MKRHDAQWRLRPQIILDIDADYIRASLLDESAVATVDTVIAVDDDNVVASGKLARDLSERINPQRTQVVYPLDDGKINHPQYLVYLIQDVVRQLSQKRLFVWQQPELFVTISQLSSDVERAAYYQILRQITTKNIWFVSSLACAAAAGNLMSSGGGVIIAELGYSGSQISCLTSTDDLTRVREIQLSEIDLLSDLYQWLKTSKDIDISRQDVNKVLKGAMLLRGGESKKRIILRGRRVSSKSPDKISCDIADANKWLENYVTDRLIIPLGQYLEDLPVALRREILARGIYLSGSLAGLTNIDRYVRDRLRVYCRRIAQPHMARVEGARLLISQGESVWQKHVL